MPTGKSVQRSRGAHPSKPSSPKSRAEVSVWARYFLALCLSVGFLISAAAAQQGTPIPAVKNHKNGNPNKKSTPARLGRLPIEWLIGPYIPIQATLHPLTNREREQIYVRQTFLTVGSYAARGFSAGLDQARGQPSEWPGGMAGYGRRYAARYGQFVVQNSMVAAGNALLGYEPRYDFCRCTGFGRAPSMPYRETLWPITGPSGSCDHRSPPMWGHSARA